MFKTSGLKNQYRELVEFDGHVRVNWGYEKIMIDDYQVDEDGHVVRDEDGVAVVVGQHEDPLYAAWWTELFDYKPSLSQLKGLILGQIDEETDRKILSGFSWTAGDGRVINVYLSSENQFNYKAAYDLAYQTEGRSLPFKLKFGATDNPQYYEFTELEEFGEFYRGCIGFIEETLQEGWKKKDAIEWEKYDLG